MAVRDADTSESQDEILAINATCNYNSRQIEFRIPHGIEKKVKATISSVIKLVTSTDLSGKHNAQRDQLINEMVFVTKFYQSLLHYFTQHNINPAKQDFLTNDVNKSVDELLDCVNTKFASIGREFNAELAPKSSFNVKSVNAKLNTIKLFSIQSGKNEFGSTFWRTLCEISKYSGKKFDTSNPMKYDDMVRHFLSKMYAIRNKIVNLNFDSVNRAKSFHQEKKKFFDDIYDNLMKFLNCDKLNVISNHMQSLGKQTFRTILYEPCLASICKNIDQLQSSIVNILDNEQLEIEPGILERMDSNFSIFKAVQDSKLYVLLKNDKWRDVGDIINKINKKITLKIYQLQKQGIRAAGNPELLVPVLITLCVVQHTLLSHKEMAKNGINECLRRYERESPGGIPLLAQRLEQDESRGGFGVLLASQHSMFRGERVSKFNRDMHSQSIDSLLTQLRCNDNSIDTSVLKQQYQQFDSSYKELVSKYVTGNEFDINIILGNATELTQEAKNRMLNTRDWQLRKQGAWNAKFKEIAVNLIAHIFALWTSLNSQYYFDAVEKKSVSDPRSYLKQPQPAQVLSILRLLSIDDKGSQLVRSLVQIGAGEGKSLTLAVTSCILALLGYDVTCACYSEYLSRRDYLDFENLFEALRIKDYIHYGTFNQLCERVINERGNVRSMVERLVTKKAETQDDLYESKVDHDGTLHCQSQKRPKVLLIDEVDAFVDKEFYGNTYTPCAMIGDGSGSNGEIKAIADYIWQSYKRNGKATVNFGTLKGSQQYVDCQARFGSYWMKLIDESIKQMLVDVTQFESTQYEVTKNGLIGYKENDGINTKANLGYQTMFTYYFEKDNGNVGEENWLNSIALYLKCGSFSYTKILSEFNIISGVTGTLETFSKTEQQVVQRQCKISRHTYMPPLYGPRKEKFSFHPLRDVRLMENTTFYENLKEEIKDKMNDHGKQRCVFVCFENKQKLNSFYECKEFALYRSNTFRLTEEADKDERNIIVKRATISGKILLLTKEFGRGTDFHVNDKIVKSNGGPHVIQTFFSTRKSEELHIQGRTARQGGRGSYSMILNKEEIMNQFHIPDKELNKADDESAIYQLLDRKRIKTAYLESLLETVDEPTQPRLDRQRTAATFVENLHNRNLKSIKRALICFNRCGSGNKRSYTHCRNTLPPAKPKQDTTQEMPIDHDHYNYEKISESEIVANTVMENITAMINNATQLMSQQKNLTGLHKNQFFILGTQLIHLSQQHDNSSITTAKSNHYSHLDYNSHDNINTDDNKDEFTTSVGLEDTMAKITCNTVEIDKWINEMNLVKNIQFRQITADYPKSIEMEATARDKYLKNTSTYFIDGIKTKSQCETAMANMEKQLINKENQKQQIETMVKEECETVDKLKDEIWRLIQKYVTQINELQNKETDYDNVNNDIKIITQQLRQHLIVKHNCEHLLNKCSELKKTTETGIDSMKHARMIAVEKFESQWIKWDYKDIVFWFKLKLGYFDKNIRGFGSTDSSNVAIARIGFDNIIYDNLKSKHYRGKFLSLLNEDDLMDLGFQSIEHQCLLVKAIQRLVLQYPIPKSRFSNVNSMKTSKRGAIVAKNDDNDNSTKNPEYICPISNQPMKEPVLAYDGCIYDKESIVKYLRQHHTTPKQMKQKKLQNKENVEQMIQMLFPQFELQRRISIHYDM